MSLIKCPECGHEISDKAKTCPHCGIELRAAENVAAPQTGSEPQPFGEFKPQSAPAVVPAVVPKPAAEKVPAAPAAPSADETEAHDAVALWRKDCRGEATFGTVYKVIYLLGYFACLILLLIWFFTVATKVFSASVDEVVKNFVEYYQKCEDALIIAIVMVLLDLLGIFDDLWKPYRVLAWSQRKNFEIRYYGENKYSWSATKTKEPVPFYGDLQYIAGSAQNSFRYRLWKVADNFLSASGQLLITLGLVLGTEEMLKGTVLMLERSVPTILWAMAGVGVALGIVNFVLKMIMKGQVKTYLSSLSKTE